MWVLHTHLITFCFHNKYVLSPRGVGLSHTIPFFFLLLLTLACCLLLFYSVNILTCLRFNVSTTYSLLSISPWPPCTPICIDIYHHHPPTDFWPFLCTIQRGWLLVSHNNAQVDEPLRPSALIVPWWHPYSQLGVRQVVASPLFMGQLPFLN